MTHKTYNTEEQALGKVCESQHKWGDDWTVEKLDALEKCVRAYLTVPPISLQFDLYAKKQGTFSEKQRTFFWKQRTFFGK